MAILTGTQELHYTYYVAWEIPTNGAPYYMTDGGTMLVRDVKHSTRLILHYVRVKTYNDYNIWLTKEETRRCVRQLDIKYTLTNDNDEL